MKAKTIQNKLKGRCDEPKRKKFWKSFSTKKSRRLFKQFHRKDIRKIIGCYVSQF